MLQINFNITDKPFVNSHGYPMVPMNASITPCSRAATNDSTPCSCQDCRDACIPTPPTPPPAKPFEILHIDGYIFIMGCIYLVFLIVFGCYSVCYNIIIQVSVASFVFGGIDLVFLDVFACYSICNTIISREPLSAWWS